MSTQLLERHEPKLLPPPPVSLLETRLDSAVRNEALTPESVNAIKSDIGHANQARKETLERMALEAIRHAESLSSQRLH